MRLVLDTNILVSALLTRNTPPDVLYQAWVRGRFSLVTSAWQIEELRRVLRYPKLRRMIRADESVLLLENLDALAEIAEPLEPPEISRDPDDNWIIATAVAGGADWLVTGDKSDLLRLGSVNQIEILSARSAVDRLETK